MQLQTWEIVHDLEGKSIIKYDMCFVGKNDMQR